MTKSIVLFGIDVLFCKFFRKYLAIY